MNHQRNVSFGEWRPTANRFPLRRRPPVVDTAWRKRKKNKARIARPGTIRPTRTPLTKTPPRNEPSVGLSQQDSQRPAAEVFHPQISPTNPLHHQSLYRNLSTTSGPNSSLLSYWIGTKYEWKLLSKLLGLIPLYFCMKPWQKTNPNAPGATWTNSLTSL